MTFYNVFLPSVIPTFEGRIVAHVNTAGTKYGTTRHAISLSPALFVFCILIKTQYRYQQ